MFAAAAYFKNISLLSCNFHPPFHSSLFLSTLYLTFASSPFLYFLLSSYCIFFYLITFPIFLSSYLYLQIAFIILSFSILSSPSFFSAPILSFLTPPLTSPSSPTFSSALISPNIHSFPSSLPPTLNIFSPRFISPFLPFPLVFRYFLSLSHPVFLSP